MSSTTTQGSDKLDRSAIITGLVIVAGSVMVILDTTIVNVALDSLSRESTRRCPRPSGWSPTT